MEKQRVITTREELERYFVLTEDEKQWFAYHGDTLPLLISSYFLGLIDPSDPNDPLRRQVVPSIRETHTSGREHADPLREVSHSIFPRLIHRYVNRVAFLVTDTCATYCRHCFRRRFTASGCTHVSPGELEQIAKYVEQHTEVKEMLLTGGDPLTLTDTRLEIIISTLRKARPDLILRLCTRMPATLPDRITEKLTTMLKAYSETAIFVMTQFNHPSEITPASRKAITRFVDAGLPVMNQTVLLRGVNDNVGTLEELMNLLVANRVKPYYLFQGDLVGGTGHLRVPLEHGLALEGQLRTRLSGLAMPVFAIDLPEGGGKVPLGARYLQGRDTDGAWIFNTLSGDRRTYPDPEGEN